MRSGYATVDGGRPLELLAFLARYAGAGRPPLGRAAAFAQARGQARAGFAAHCEVGQRLGARLGLPEAAQAALGFVFERWDGKGYPNGARGEAIPLAARIVHVARDAVVLRQHDAPDAVRAEIARRAGGAYDPRLAALLTAELLDAAAAATWDTLLADDAAPRGRLAADAARSPFPALDDALGAVADFADLKSPATLGHSRRVAELAEAAAWRLGLGAAGAAEVRRAALVHDLGRVAVSNAIWDKPGPLTDAEWERVRLHPYFTARALSRLPVLAALGELAAAHHERVGGGGYHRGVDAARLPLAARIIAAADAYAAMTEPRAHRAALAPAAAVDALRAAALDQEAAEAVLAAAGQRAKPVRRALPAGLSAREAEVLVLVARGHANKAIAGRLGISAKTVGHHVGHVYAKIGVSTRAAAALFAVEQRLIEP